MIWRLAHPVRGVAAGLVVLVVARCLLGFAMGIGELALVLVVAATVVVLVARSGGVRAPGMHQVARPILLTRIPDELASPSTPPSSTEN